MRGRARATAGNLLDATNGFTLLVEDEGAVADLPRDVVEAARRTAGTKDGKGLRFTLLAPSYVPFIAFLPAPQLAADDAPRVRDASERAGRHRP